MVLIYAHEITPRLDYTVGLLFRHVLQTSVAITTNPQEFQTSGLPKFNYSNQRLSGDELFLSANELLFNHEIIVGRPELVAAENGTGGFFPTSHDSFLPYDALASAFMVLTRMEEYQPGERDQHGRFTARQSLLFHYNLLEKPVVNLWALLLAEKIGHKFPGFIFKKPPFQYLTTIDIDNAWACLHKGVFRTAAAFVRDVAAGNFKSLETRIKVLTGQKADPFDTYSYLFNTFKGRERNTIFFLLLARYGKYDKAVPHGNRHFRALVQNIAGKFKTGIHPGYGASLDTSGHILQKEASLLANITGLKPVRSRQHYLRLEFPETYRKLLRAGITEDYTMGYACQPGFRAGTCTPHYFYDLQKEEATPLMVYPFQVMDVTLKHYLKLGPEEAIARVSRLMKEVRATGGLFAAIWHNESLSEQGEWSGYRQVFESMNQEGFSHAES